MKTGHNKENPSKELYQLLVFYKQLIQLLEVFFRGYLLIADDQICRDYLRLCNMIQEILERPGLEHLAALEWRPFDNLRTLDPDAPDVEWEYGGQQLCSNFLSSIEDTWISTGEKSHPLDLADHQLLGQVQTDLVGYLKYKKEYEAKWLQRVENLAEERQRKETMPYPELPQFDFQFIGDSEIRDLLIRDWQEAKKAFANGLNKSTVMLCGTIIEALLVDALSSIKDEAKFRYYQKYLESKNKGGKPPEIEYWQIYQLIELAKDQAIISNDAAKFSHTIRDYRNLIHLFAQKREGLQIDDHIASVVVNLLAIVYDDVLHWHEKAIT